MKKIMSHVTIFSLIFGLYSCSPSDSLSPNGQQELEDAEKAMFNATSFGDSAAFRKICGIDYYTINANGEAHTLEETIPSVPRFKGSTTSLSEQKQRLYGDLALRTGRAKFYFGGKQVAEALYTTGWIYRDGRWQFIHWQGTMTGMMLDSIRGKINLEPPALDESK